MAIDSTGGSKPYIKPKPPEPKPEVKPATTAKAQPQTTSQTARNTVKPQQGDGFESKPATSTARGQQAERLGSTTAPTTAQTASPQDKGVLAKLGLTPEDLKKAGQAALPHLEKAAQAVVGGHPEQALEHLRNAALSSPEGSSLEAVIALISGQWTGSPPFSGW